MSDREEEIRERCRAGRTDEALALAVEVYGAEVYGFLVSRLRDDVAASDAFSQACEDLCASIGAFEWRCSMRTWMYKLARSAAARERERHVRAARDVPLSAIAELAQSVSSRTREYLRTEVKDRFAALREELAPEDQALLILRVDRGLEWSDVAEILSDHPLDAEEQKRASARLRQRFKSLKTDLRRRAIEAGLIGEDPAI